MTKKIKIIVFLTFISFTSYSQLLKETKILFTHFKAIEKVNNSLLNGNIIKEGEGNTSIKISNIGINTYIAFESTVVKIPEQVYIVSNIVKVNEDEKLVCDVEAYNGQDPDRKNVRFVLVYANGILEQFIMPVSNYVMQYY
jgi:hypothetical protein